MIAAASVAAATVPPGFTDTLVASGLNTPTAMAIAPDGRIFVCQQGGALRVIKNGVLLPMPFLTVTVDSSGERGLSVSRLVQISFRINWSISITPLPRHRFTTASAVSQHRATWR